MQKLITAMNKGSAPAYSSTDADDSDQEDRELVRAAVDGDSEAFDGLYRKYRERVYRVAFRVLHHREDALEATQDVFIKVYRALARFDPAARFFTWIYRIAMNQAIDTIRRRKIRREQVFEEDFVGDERAAAAPRGDSRAPDPVASLVQGEVRDRVEAALSGLSEKHRAVFLLYSFEELGYTEIAEVLEIPLGTVMSRLFYARREIKNQLPVDWDPGGPRRREDRRSD